MCYKYYIRICMCVERLRDDCCQTSVFFLLYTITYPSERVDWVYSEDETNFVYIYNHLHSMRAQFLSRICFSFFWLIMLTYYYGCCRRHPSSHLTLSVLMNRENMRTNKKERLQQKKRWREKKVKVWAIRSFTFIVHVKSSTNSFLAGKVKSH